MSYSHRWSSNRGNTHADLLQFHKEAKNRSLLMLLLCVKRICSDKDAARMSDVLRDYAKVGFDVHRMAIFAIDHSGITVILTAPAHCLHLFTLHTYF
jgi:hypothetical protein